ncbi:MAG: hypothetical protein D3903_20425 [Candidatus Electrothrix sp. GM3_4]|nr:hypothetical protein [Candidatus Electrothrix sp. GM3_4]
MVRAPGGCWIGELSFCRYRTRFERKMPGPQGCGRGRGDRRSSGFSWGGDARADTQVCPYNTLFIG